MTDTMTQEDTRKRGKRAEPPDAEPPARITRKPHVGAWVYYWLADAKGDLHPTPAQLISRGRIRGWQANVHKFNAIPRGVCADFSPDGRPRNGCLTMDLPEENTSAVE